MDNIALLRKGEGGERRRRCSTFEYVNYPDPENKAVQQTPKPWPSPMEITSWFLLNLKNEVLRNKLCVKDISGSRKCGLSTSIKTLDLDDWVLRCDGTVEVTKTKEAEAGKVTTIDSPPTEVEGGAELKPEVNSELKGVVFPKPAGAGKDRRSGRWPHHAQ